MLKSILAEECTRTKLAPLLERILNDLDKESTHHDYIVALIIVLLAEAGFYLSPSYSDRPQCPKLLYIPKNWKSRDTGIYEMYFQLESVPDIECKLVVIPLGDTLILNFFSLMDGKTTYSISVQTLKYVNPYSSDLYGRYMNLKAISHRFKDQLSTPVRRDVFIKAGIMGPSLETIPIELKLRILRLMDAYSVTRMAQCCKAFHDICSESQLWKDLICRDFPGCYRTVSNDKDCYRFILPLNYCSYELIPETYRKSYFAVITARRSHHEEVTTHTRPTLDP
ncbi:F-box only protein 7-like [Bombus pascuorum]|uniref:F-box only protein 7-like n=1 Tax=Bombus pascuorum TaxID=65598 RepID=UPI002145F061|nr:F-box only protein 7-like [Bombus pascuorum]